jgi:DNA helicase-2/ATP-dependent DNA helicase PcrA
VAAPRPAKASARGAKEAALAALTPEERALFDRLRDWRRDRAAALEQPAFCVFSDATLTAISRARPAGRGELARVSGVGPAKLEQFGAEVLAVVAGG